MPTRSRIVGVSAVAGWILGIALLLSAPDAQARSTFFTNACATCHTDDTPTCNACHHHRGSLSATADMAEYEPGTLVTITLNGGEESGWIRGLLYDELGNEVDRATGPTGTGNNGQGSGVTFPVTLQANAPATPGQYVWQAAWFGSTNDTGANHGESRRSVTIVVSEGTTGVGDEGAGDFVIEEESWGELKHLYRR